MLCFIHLFNTGWFNTFIITNEYVPLYNSCVGRVVKNVCVAVLEYYLVFHCFYINNFSFYKTLDIAFCLDFRFFYRVISAYISEDQSFITLHAVFQSQMPFNILSTVVPQSLGVYRGRVGLDSQVIWITKWKLHGVANIQKSSLSAKVIRKVIIQ